MEKESGYPCNCQCHGQAGEKHIPQVLDRIIFSVVAHFTPLSCLGFRRPECGYKTYKFLHGLQDFSDPAPLNNPPGQRTIVSCEVLRELCFSASHLHRRLA